ncbi:ATP-binding cassette domain-containing protein [Neorhizobium galegae]|uniref:ATP-binding cassette domain-containing protein n=1 Tax=Neorhizobium galegae TaxID=399 RepID=UPI002100A358|nr:ATP-binding cassette domain-containing protein [Neorhizobium galegae]MCQ1574893.1 ATP-binding cassette domain-containing protein [Neorhizobium galegae]MCQ1807892.1 ATP-binding cassette domain-containing protein [Neorhizobium galegae]MCQ1837714.1 ATP-binding cassette domain-containing protein [Neorhizobium galegae]
MVFAYLAYKAQFLEKTGNLVDQGMAFLMLRLHLERLSDIALEDDDRSFGSSANFSTELKGQIELRSVSYRYSPTDPLVLNNVDLVVRPGEHVAITGPSGAGKSTLLKIVFGLLEPHTGEVLVDGIPLRQFGHNSFHDQIAAVLQDDNLFAGSIADNIAMFDEHPDFPAIVEATRSAAIHDEVLDMPMRYETLVGDMGSSLSGGQKQRVLLARAALPKAADVVSGRGNLTHGRRERGAREAPVDCLIDDPDPSLNQGQRFDLRPWHHRIALLLSNLFSSFPHWS